MKFHGTLEDLEEIMLQITSWPEWSGARNKYQCRVPNDAVLNWWPSTGTIHIQGPEEAAAELETALMVLVPSMAQSPQIKRRLRTGSIEVEYKEVKSVERSAALKHLPSRLPKRT